MRLLSTGQRVAYLERIGMAGRLPPNPRPGPSTAVPGDAAVVAALQAAHLRTVPFENLDIHLGRAIVLDPDRIYAKVVERRRGGYCYELNSLFARLLASHGFEPQLVSAEVARDDGTFSEPFDHLALLVSASPAGGGARRGGGGVPHLVDVGFGDAFTVPIPLVDGAVVDDRDRRVRLRRVDGRWYHEEDRGRGWTARYRFDATPHDLAAFASRNRWQQSSPDSHFTRQTVATVLTDTGRTTFSGGVPGGSTGARVIVTDLGGHRHERAVPADGVRVALADELGLDLPPGPSTVGLTPTLASVDPAVLANPMATLATNGPDGRPQLSAVRFVVEDDAIHLSATEGTVGVRNLRRDRRCTVLVLDPASPDRQVEIRGAATLDDEADVASAAHRGGRDTDLRTGAGPDDRRVRIVIRPTRIVATDTPG